MKAHGRDRFPSAAMMPEDSGPRHHKVSSLMMPSASNKQVRIRADLGRFETDPDSETSPSRAGGEDGFLAQALEESQHREFVLTSQVSDLSREVDILKSQLRQTAALPAQSVEKLVADLTKQKTVLEDKLKQMKGECERLRSKSAPGWRKDSGLFVAKARLADVVKEANELRMKQDKDEDSEDDFSGDGVSSTTTSAFFQRPTWTIADWLGTSLNAVIAESIMNSVKEFKDFDELVVAKALGTKADESLVKELFESTKVTEHLARVFLRRAAELAQAAAASGEELNAKFATQEGNIDMVYGNLSDFSMGLEHLIGAPSVRVFDAMKDEHTCGPEAHREWTTGNYGMTTTPAIEWRFVNVTEGNDEIWPVETKNVSNANHHRQVMYEDERRSTLEMINANLTVKSVPVEKHLSMNEFLGARLYTGPMFEKYNAVNRGGGLHADQPEKLRERFQSLCQGNRYTTTIHVINSALIKLSKLSEVVTVYRGITGALLPDSFWRPGGDRGGVEFSFMSTTTNKKVAMQYASERGASTVLEIQTGAVDRGADLSRLSQYPHEKEICFPPLSNLQVLKTRVEGSVLVVEVRLNVNMTALTIEEVVSKRKKVVLDMTSNLREEVQAAMTNEHDEMLQLQNIGDGTRAWTIVDRAKGMLSMLSTQDPEVYNEDKTLLECIEKAFSVKRHVDCLAQFARAAVLCKDLDDTDELTDLESADFIIDVLNGADVQALDVVDAVKELCGISVEFEDEQVRAWYDQLQSLAAVLGDVSHVTAGLESADEKLRAQAAEAIRHQAEQHTDAAVRGVMFSLTKTALLGVLERGPDEAPWVLIVVCRALGAMGSVAVPAVPALIRLFGDDRSGSRFRSRGSAHLGRDQAVRVLDCAMDALAKIGPRAADELAGALRHPDAAFRRTAAEVLGFYGADARDKAEDLVLLLGDAEGSVRRAAAMALAAMGQAAEEQVQALIGCLGPRQSVSSLSACLTALGKIKEQERGIFVALSVGRCHNVALTSKGELRCWGENNHKQISQVKDNEKFRLAPGEVFTMIGSGPCADHSVALTSHKRILCWGYSRDGQCDVPDLTLRQNESFVGLAAGAHHSIALTSLGNIFIWGGDSVGQRSRCPSLRRGERLVAVSAGSSHTAALTSTGRAVCWGWDIAGQCSPVPKLRDGECFKAVAAGSQHTAALTSLGRIVCWGSDSDGQSSIPKAFAGLRFCAVSAGVNHTAALTEDGRVVCWGKNINGQCTKIPDLGEAPERGAQEVLVTVAAGSQHTAALTSAGRVLCWGANRDKPATIEAPELGLQSMFGSLHWAAGTGNNNWPERRKR